MIWFLQGIRIAYNIDCYIKILLNDLMYLYWPRWYRTYILQITQPSQSRYAKLPYRFPVTSGSPSTIYWNLFNNNNIEITRFFFFWCGYRSKNPRIGIILIWGPQLCWAWLRTVVLPILALSLLYATAYKDMTFV